MSLHLSDCLGWGKGFRPLSHIRFSFSLFLALVRADPVMVGLDICLINEVNKYLNAGPRRTRCRGEGTERHRGDKTGRNSGFGEDGRSRSTQVGFSCGGDCFLIFMCY